MFDLIHRKYGFSGWAGLLLCSIFVLGGCQSVPTTATSPTAADTPEAAQRLVIYSGRSENLIGPLIDQVRQTTGIEVEVRYGDTAEMAATILEEGSNSPADLFFAQDAGALRALWLRPAGSARCRMKFLTKWMPVIAVWTATGSGSAAARVYSFSTQTALTAEDLPETVFQLAEPQWQGQVGWAPTNGSFQSFVTAMRVLNGDDTARQSDRGDGSQ